MKQIVCMKWGTKYGAEFVNKLYAMVLRNTSGDFRFVCLTDDINGVREEVECLDCPTVPLSSPLCDTGWRKIALWKEHLDGMQGDWLFLDLDVVITGNLDVFFEYKTDKSFIVMHNWTQPGKQIGNTSVYRFRVGNDPYLYTGMVAGEMNDIIDKYHNEQTFVSRLVNDINFWPDEWCLLFKVQCVPDMPARWWKEPGLPDNTRIVAFPGSPNPDEAAAGRWPAKWYKKIYKHIKPVKWVELHWRE